MTETARYHPRDTVEVFRQIEKKIEEKSKEKNEEGFENIWYEVHYFQVIRHIKDEKDKNNICKNLKSSLSLRVALKSLKDVVNLRVHALLSSAPSDRVCIASMHLNGRLVHGLGGAHCRETALTLHPLYGVPYIPASSLKGLVRHWLTAQFGKADWIRVMLGDENCEGCVRFYDALPDPATEWELRPDVLTVHFPDYYAGQKAATDDQEPKPVEFWTVATAAEKNSGDDPAKPARMLFMLSAAGPGRDGRDWLEVACIALSRALTEWGIGSKTSSGYGRFDDWRDETAEWVERFKQETERRRAEAERRRREEEQRRLEEERQRLEEERRRRFETMPLEDRLCEEIAGLGKGGQDIERSKKLFKDFINQLPGDAQKKVAAALKAYWQSVGEWEGSKLSSKQREKVQQIRRILGE